MDVPDRMYSRKPLFPSRVRMEQLTLLGSPSKLYEIYQGRMYIRKLLIMDRGNAQNM